MHQHLSAYGEECDLRDVARQRTVEPAAVRSAPRRVELGGGETVEVEVPTTLTPEARAAVEALRDATPEGDPRAQLFEGSR